MPQDPSDHRPDRRPDRGPDRRPVDRPDDRPDDTSSERHERDRRDKRRPEQELDARTGRSAAAARIAHQQTWVDQQLRVAMERGDFDDLPGAGKPIRDLGGTHDPDWWVKRLVEREQVTGLLPASLQLRKDDAELDERLDRQTVESEVRREVDDFNERVIHARYSLTPGPPLITMPRDVEETVTAWRERREVRRHEQAAAVRAAREAREAEPPPRRWWRRRARSAP